MVYAVFIRDQARDREWSQLHVHDVRATFAGHDMTHRVARGAPAAAQAAT